MPIVAADTVWVLVSAAMVMLMTPGVALSAITRGARTGEIGGGKVFIIPVDDAVRIRTGDFGENAV